MIPAPLILALAFSAAAAVYIMSQKSGSLNTNTMPTGPVGRYFTWHELLRSNTAARLGLNNAPTPEAKRALELLVYNVLDPLREAVGRPVLVGSGYRHPDVNRAVDGSAEHSQHSLGEAVDIKVPGMTAVELAGFLVRLGLPFDELIWYAPERGGHVHVSFTTRRANNYEVMHAPAGGGYKPWSFV